RAARRVLYWYDPMHPAYKSDKPGTAPDCGMTLVPFYADDPQASAPREAKAADLPMGTIQIAPERQQLIGVKYGFPESGASTREMRAVGKVAPDEKRITHVHTRVEAWIDKVFADFTGKAVEAGQPLLTLYSPDLLASQQEYLLALKSKDLLTGSTLPGVREQSDSLIAAAHERLRNWDLSESQFVELARTRKALQNVTLFAPGAGYVIARNAFPKLHVTPDTELYTLVDLSKVWIMADVFENEAPQIQLGQPVSIKLSYASGKTLHGTVDYIQPQVDPVTRTLKVRIDVPNPDMVLKPDMFVDVTADIAIPPRITVPSEAVLDSGLRKTVFVDRGNGYLEPRTVETGERAGDRVEILKGLRPNERIAVSGTFLIDSESQLKAAASGMGAMSGMPGMPPAATTPSGQDMKGMPGMNGAGK
ncbi:MAG: efflux RND transporter periplasmic adaptor subunit, partial [Acidobacteriota bacterium]|nr:efflux RND transporter periplasmic adaptor subunit [Acidobacteriota bacterium]